MSDMKNSAGKQSSENTFLKLVDVARRIMVSADYLNENAEVIITSCHTQGTKGETQKSLLLRRADDMKVSVGLLMSIAKRYEYAALKLIEGVSGDKVLNELESYNVCISDQIKSELESYEQILSVLTN